MWYAYETLEKRCSRIVSLGDKITYIIRKIHFLTLIKSLT